MWVYEVTEPVIPTGPRGMGSFDGVPIGVPFYIEGSQAKINLSSVENDKIGLDILVDPKINQTAEMAKSAGQKIYQGEIVRSDGHISLVEQTTDKRMALVLLRTQPGIRGVLKVTSTAYDEVEDRGTYEGRTHKRISKSYRAFPPLGVSLLNPEHVAIAEDGTCTWNPELGVSDNETTPPLVLEMVSGSSVHVWRTGDVGTAIRDFFIVWDGHYGRLKTFRRT